MSRATLFERGFNRLGLRQVRRTASRCLLDVSASAMKLLGGDLERLTRLKFFGRNEMTAELY